MKMRVNALHHPLHIVNFPYRTLLLFHYYHEEEEGDGQGYRGREANGVFTEDVAGDLGRGQFDGSRGYLPSERWGVMLLSIVTHPPPDHEMQGGVINVLQISKRRPAAFKYFVWW